MAHVVFVNTPGHSQTIFTVYPPVGILSMSACLKKRGHRVTFVDADVNRLTPEQTLREISKLGKVDLIGFTLNVAQVSHILPYLSLLKIKFPKIPIVLGGPYVTGVQREIYNDFPMADFAISNEGEFAICDLIECLNRRMPISQVRNLIYRKKDETFINSISRIENISGLPLPDYDLVGSDLHKYPGASPSIASPSIAVMCTRGCPFNCTFCSSPTTWKRHLTTRSVDSVIKEIKYLKSKFNVKEIFFQDDTMNVRREWFFDLCDRIIEEGFHKNTFFKCPFRVNKTLLDEKILKKAKEANFWMIFFGVENGNQKMLDSMNKNITISEIKRAFKLTRKAGICSYASLMIGNPGETANTVRDSIKIVRDILPDYGGFAITAPFPGSKLSETAKEKKLILLNDFKKYQFGDCILRTEDLTKGDILRLYKSAEEKFARYLTTSRYKMASKNNPFLKLFPVGLYNVEHWDIDVRRSGKNVSFFVMTDNLIINSINLRLLSDDPKIQKRPVSLTVKVNQHKYVKTINFSDWFIVSIPIKNKLKSNLIHISWHISRSWNPKKNHINNDNRDLGFTIEKIWTEHVDKKNTLIKTNLLPLGT